MPKGLKILAVISSLSMLFVLIGGALVTKTGSGQGCGKSWPLCEGQLIPSNIDLELIIELSHRIVSGLSAIIVFTFAIWCWRRIGDKPETKFLAVFSILFLIIQALMGAGAVLWGQAPVIMALHFGISLISFASVFLLTLLVFEVDQKFDISLSPIPVKVQREIVGLAIYSYGVIFTGALVRHKKATLSCLDFPLCNNNTPGFANTPFEWVQMSHRIAAILFFIWLFIFTIKIIKNYSENKVLYWTVIISFILICLQVASGIAIIYSLGNLSFALFHALIISSFFGIWSYLLLLCHRRNKRRKRPD
jgi:cytochrome c oxidase assembly protein subunit 15